MSIRTICGIEVPEWMKERLNQRSPNPTMNDVLALLLEDYLERKESHWALGQHKAAREAFKLVLKSKGCTLKDNDDIVDDSSGKAVAFFQGAKWTDTGLDFNVKMYQSLEFIQFEVTLGDHGNGD